MIRRLHEEGMTGFKDPSIGREDWEAYIGLAKAGNFPINACVLFSGGRSMATATKALADGTEAFAAQRMNRGIQQALAGRRVQDI